MKTYETTCSFVKAGTQTCPWQAKRELPYNVSSQLCKIFSFAFQMSCGTEHVLVILGRYCLLPPDSRLHLLFIHQFPKSIPLYHPASPFVTVNSFLNLIKGFVSRTARGQAKSYGTAEGWQHRSLPKHNFL